MFFAAVIDPGTYTYDTSVTVIYGDNLCCG